MLGTASIRIFALTLPSAAILEEIAMIVAMDVVMGGTNKCSPVLLFFGLLMPHVIELRRSTERYIK